MQLTSNRQRVASLVCSRQHSKGCVHTKGCSSKTKLWLLCSSADIPLQSSSVDLEAAKGQHTTIKQDVILRLEHLSPSEMKYTLWLLFVATLIGLVAVLAELSVKVTKVWRHPKCSTSVHLLVPRVRHVLLALRLQANAAALLCILQDGMGLALPCTICSSP